MKATLITKERVSISDRATVYSLIWKVPHPVIWSAHLYKYSLAFVVDGLCVLRYDNERGKGDHRHVGMQETSYAFTSPKQLLVDFWAEVRSYME